MVMAVSIVRAATVAMVRPVAMDMVRPVTMALLKRECLPLSSSCITGSGTRSGSFRGQHSGSGWRVWVWVRVRCSVVTERDKGMLCGRTALHKDKGEIRLGLGRAMGLIVGPRHCLGYFRITTTYVDDSVLKGHSRKLGFALAF